MANLLNCNRYASGVLGKKETNSATRIENNLLLFERSCI